MTDTTSATASYGQSNADEVPTLTIDCFAPRVLVDFGDVCITLQVSFHSSSEERVRN